MFSKVALVVAMAAYASAQTSIPDYKSSLDMLKGLDVNSIDLGVRKDMCVNQIVTCGVLCNNNNDADTCDETTLQYSCICSSNHSSPALEYYGQTLPNSVCERVIFPNCINSNTQDADAQEKCKTKIWPLCRNATYGGANPTTAASPSKTGGTNQDGSTVSTSSKSGFAAPTAVPLGAAAAAGVIAYFL